MSPHTQKNTLVVMPSQHMLATILPKDFMGNLYFLIGFPLQILFIKSAIILPPAPVKILRKKIINTLSLARDSLSIVASVISQLFQEKGKKKFILKQSVSSDLLSLVSLSLNHTMTINSKFLSLTTFVFFHLSCYVASTLNSCGAYSLLHVYFLWQATACNESLRHD